jgi:hypothetical protein
LEPEVDYRIELNFRRLKRFDRFDWKVHFLKTFASLFIFFLIIIIIAPRDFFTIDYLDLIAIGLWVMLGVCAIVTPTMAYVYMLKYKRILNELEDLLKDHETDSSK